MRNVQVIDMLMKNDTPLLRASECLAACPPLHRLLPVLHGMNDVIKDEIACEEKGDGDHVLSLAPIE